ncbi:MAG: hypothetical protein NTZ83_06005 [Candidatus Pacearchaeota archaeon]|nr:hypothetical protein [Candidatus Pacearchaeota archaeon]
MDEETRMDTRIIVGRLFDDKIVSMLEMDKIKRGDTKGVRRYNEIINQIAYPIEKIEKLMKEGNLEEAQQVYFEYETKRREGIIRL